MNNRKLLIGILSVLLSPSVSFAQNNAGVEEGKKIFMQICAACHKANSDKFIGPGLRGIEQRRPLDWIVKFVHNSDAVIKSGDEYAIKLFEEYNKMPMTPNPDLTESQIKNVLAYIKSEEIKENGEKDNKQSQTQVGGSGRNIVIMESFQSAKKQETVFSQAFVIFSAIIGLIFAFGMIYWIVGHTKKKS